jgi:hypothetical protein
VTDLDLPLTAEDARFKQIMIRDFIHIWLGLIYSVTKYQFLYDLIKSKSLNVLLFQS